MDEKEGHQVFPEWNTGNGLHETQLQFQLNVWDFVIKTRYVCSELGSDDLRPEMTDDHLNWKNLWGVDSRRL